MADMTRIKGRIQEVIRPNGVGAITAAEHQSLLLEMVDDINNKKADQSELIATQENLDALEQKVDNLPQGEDFDKQGNYPLLHVGTADDLAGRGESVPASFGFRASGGKSIKDGRAYIKRIKGNSVVWNQLFYNGDFSLGNKHWNIMNNNSFTVDDGVATIKLESEPQNDYWAYIVMNTTSQFQQKRIVGHRYLFMCSAWLTKTANFIISSAGTTFITSNTFNSVPTNTWVTYGAIAEATEERNASFAAYPRQKLAGYVAGDIWKIKGYKTIDLTKMFGAGNEPTTIEDFYARVATLGVDMNAYNEGQVIHCNTESIKSVGDNAWDGVLATSYNTSKIRCLPNEQYCLCGPYYNDGAHSVTFYDSEDNKISGIRYMIRFFLFNNKSSIFTTPANCAYFVFEFNANYPPSGYKDQVVISLYHSGWKAEVDNTYKPYWQDTLPLPIIRNYFPQGMKSAGTAHDEIRYNKATNKWEAVQRFGAVDLGTFDWIQATSPNGFNFFYTRKGISDAGNENRGNNILTPRYTAAKKGANEFADKDMRLFSDKLLYIRDDAYTDTASFKAAMQGVILYYELETPIVTKLDAEDQFRDYYNVADFGTEEAIPATDAEGNIIPSANFSADIIYQFNAVDMIREHEIEITELQSIITEQQSVIATMQAQLTSLINGGQ